MCGIVGYIGNKEAYPILVKGLQRLEYRGYDSAGVALINQGEINLYKKQGKVVDMESVAAGKDVSGTLGIGHTRWATHGKPTQDNAHPHISNNSVAVVHNGIIDNCDSIRAALIADGYAFASETDTEVIAHAFHQAYEKTGDTILALRQTCDRLTGSYAFGLVMADDPEQLWAACHGSPLVVGLGDQSHYIASDMVALAALTSRYIYLEDGDTVAMTKDCLQILNHLNQPVTREVHELSLSAGQTSKGAFRHHMQKEIHEQPVVIKSTLAGRLTQEDILASLFPQEALAMLAGIERVQIVACGTSYNAGLVASYWFESLTALPCQVEIASEYRYRPHVVKDSTLFLTISQSGETADTIAALKHAQKSGYQATVTVCNVANSALARLSDYVLLTQAGVEIGVASTKAFTTQLIMLLLLVVGMGEQREQKGLNAIKQGLEMMPEAVETLLSLSAMIEPIAQWLSHYHHALYLGRNVCYPIAKEGALKLKEISYIHAEAYPAGELKHGALALVDEAMPVVILAPGDALIDKLHANVQEVAARGGPLLVITDVPERFSETQNTRIIPMPKVIAALVPLLYTIPLQLLAYAVATARGTDVDQPRNLAKSVTVE